MGRNPHPSFLYVGFVLALLRVHCVLQRASSVGNKRKEKGWMCSYELCDRLAICKNSEGMCLTAASVAHSEEEKKSAAVAQHRQEPADIHYRELNIFKKLAPRSKLPLTRFLKNAQ